MIPLLLILCLSVNYQLSESCSCIQSTGQDLFCGADYVVLVKIKNFTIPADEQNQQGGIISISTGDETIFTVKIKKIYKGAAALASVDTSVVYSVRDGSSCGVHLSVGQKYILGGNIHDMKMRIFSCELVLSWRNLTYKKLLKKYKANCDCKTTVCHGCGTAGGAGFCTLDTSLQPLYSCLSTSGYCAANKKGLCKWKSLDGCTE